MRFGKAYAKGRSSYTNGKVVSIKGKKVGVKFKGENKVYDTNQAHLERLPGEDESQEGNVVATVKHQGKCYKKSQTFYTIMASLEVNCALKRSAEEEESSWPKDLFESLVRNDWRQWVEAVQKRK